MWYMVFLCMVSYVWNFKKFFTMVTNNVAYESTLYKWPPRSALGVCILAQSMVSLPVFPVIQVFEDNCVLDFLYNLHILKVSDEDCCSYLFTDSFSKVSERNSRSRFPLTGKVLSTIRFCHFLIVFATLKHRDFRAKWPDPRQCA